MRTMHLFLASAAATAALLSGVYTAAATAATSLAASINREETARHTRSVEFSARVNQAWAEYPTQARERNPTPPITKRQTRP
jgi:hypothetical protein